MHITSYHVWHVVHHTDLTHFVKPLYSSQVTEWDNLCKNASRNFYCHFMDFLYFIPTYFGFSYITYIVTHFYLRYLARCLKCMIATILVYHDKMCLVSCAISKHKCWAPDIEGILPSMAGRVLLAGYPRYTASQLLVEAAFHAAHIQTNHIITHHWLAYRSFKTYLLIHDKLHLIKKRYLQLLHTNCTYFATSSLHFKGNYIRRQKHCHKKYMCRRNVIHDAT